MSVYVGKREYKHGRMIMFHMIADELTELYDMAFKIDLPDKHFQPKDGMPHFDISKGYKQKAIKLGAIEIDDREIVKILRKTYLTFKQAKDLSEKKWSYIVENNGSIDGLLTKYPILHKMSSNCAMCEYSDQVDWVDGCKECHYSRICEITYHKWLDSVIDKRMWAEQVLKEIKQVNSERIRDHRTL